MGMLNNFRSGYNALKKGEFGKFMWEDVFGIEYSSPNELHLHLAFVPLARVKVTQKGKKEDTQREFVGSFVPELYLLANSNNLKTQIEFQQWAKKQKEAGKDNGYLQLKAEKPELFKALFVVNEKQQVIKRTPFELAIIASKNRDYIASHVKEEYKWRLKQHLVLPPLESKLTALPQFLPHLNKMGLEIANDPAIPNSTTIDLSNQLRIAPARQKLIHFLMPWMGLFATTGAVLTLGVTSPIFFAFVALATYFVTHQINMFDYFDRAVALSRALGWMASNDFKWIDGFSLKNTLSSIIKLGLIGLITGLTALGLMSGLMAIPMATLGIPLLAQQALAAVITSSTAVGAFIGLVSLTKFIYGITFSNKEAHICPDAVRRLPVVDKAPKLRYRSQLDAKIEKLADAEKTLKIENSGLKKRNQKLMGSCQRRLKRLNAAKEKNTRLEKKLAGFGQAKEAISNLRTQLNTLSKKNEILAKRVQQDNRQQAKIDQLVQTLEHSQKSLNQQVQICQGLQNQVAPAKKILQGYANKKKIEYKGQTYNSDVDFGPVIADIVDRTTTKYDAILTAVEDRVKHSRKCRSKK